MEREGLGAGLLEILKWLAAATAVGASLVLLFGDRGERPAGAEKEKPDRASRRAAGLAPKATPANSPETSPETRQKVEALLVDLGSSDSKSRQDALRGLAGLGPAAEDAVPALTRLASEEMAKVEGETQEPAKGRKGRGGLEAMFAEAGERVTLIGAIGALGSIGPAAEESVPILIRALKDEQLKLSAAVSLGRIGRRPEIAIPALAEALAGMKTGEMFFGSAIFVEALAGFGEGGIPFLEEAGRHPSLEVQKAAAQALQKLKKGR